MISSIFLLSTILVLSAAAPAAELRGYVVYTGAASPSNLALKEAIINRMSGQLLRTYRHGFSGFAARLSPQEATFISMQPGVVSVFEDTYLKLLTTRSWGFLASLEGSYANPAYPYACSSDIVVGFIDSGIWPESESFRPASSAPPPVGWNGTCQTSKDFNMSSCNGKIVGARFYVGESARDVEGHGSHVASTAAGMEVKASYYGLAAGTARGGSESARIAVYKACLPLFGCLSSAILSAFDDAIRDGVNVISVSVGSTQLTPLDFTEDPIAIGAFHATERGILVVCAGGNSGPARSSIKNDAPWILTVAASTMDRNFETNVVLAGANKTIKGRSIGFSKLSRSPIYPLTTGEVAVDKNRQAARECHLDSLKASKVKGKIVVCETSASTTYLSDQRAEIVSKGGVGMVVVSDTESRVPGFYGDFPITIVSLEEANKLMTYLNTTRNPMGTILGTVTVGHQKPAPEVAFFSSRGPSMVSGNIIKPDITAPGVAILAAWTGNDSSIATPTGRAPPTYIIISGTSMACPHISGVAANVRSAVPTLTAAGVKSAIMTTAVSTNNLGTAITTDEGHWATPYDIGAGILQPTKALRPGLIYETTADEYLQFLCYHGYNTTTVKSISRTAARSFRCPAGGANRDLISSLNYPSISVRLSRMGARRTIPRRLTNVAATTGNDTTAWVYQGSIGLDGGGGVVVKVVPRVLKFVQEGETKAFKVIFQSNRTVGRKTVTGWVKWTNRHFTVRSVFVAEMV